MTGRSQFPETGNVSTYQIHVVLPPNFQMSIGFHHPLSSSTRPKLLHRIDVQMWPVDHNETCNSGSCRISNWFQALWGCRGESWNMNKQAGRNKQSKVWNCFCWERLNRLWSVLIFQPCHLFRTLDANASEGSGGVGCAVLG